jgi:D-psicose/D-tagatose/L-ribulose 3-epimerase
MTRTLGLSSFTLASPFSQCDAEAFDRTAAFGYDLIEICVEDPALLSGDWIVEQAERTGLAVGICGAFGPGRDVSSPDATMRASGLTYLRTCIDLAASVGSPHVAGPMYAVTGETQMRGPEERRAQFDRASQSLAEAAVYARERGIRLAIEPLNRFETDLVNTVEQGLTLCAAIGADNVGLLIDTFHMNIEEKRVGDAVRTAGDRVFHVQASENDRGTPGSGHVPWGEFYEALDDIGYGGQIVVESFLPTVREIARAVSLWRPVASSMDDLARDGLEFLRARESGGAG